MNYNLRKGMGDIRSMVFEDYFDRFLSERGSSRTASNQISI